MNTAGHEYPSIVTVEVTDRWITAAFSDGRQVSLPLTWSWRLERATREQRALWRSSVTERAYGGLKSTRISARAASSWARRLPGPAPVPLEGRAAPPFLPAPLFHIVRVPSDVHIRPPSRTCSRPWCRGHVPPLVLVLRQIATGRGPGQADR